MIYEWKGYDCPGTGSRHELSRIIEGNQGLHRIAYTEKSEAMADENRSYWLNVFRQAYVAQGTRAVVRE